MKLNGTHELKASRDVIWEMLMNPDQLARITPGISKLNKIEDNQFEAVAEVKIGPVKGSFKGDLIMQDLEKPERFTLKVKQESKIGNVAATIGIELLELDHGNTQVSFDGDAQLSGLIARTGQRVVSGVANSLTKQFFEAFEKEIETLST